MDAALAAILSKLSSSALAIPVVANPNPAVARVAVEVIMDARNACRVLGIDLVTLYSSLPSLPSLAPSAFMYRALLLLLLLVVVGILLAEGVTMEEVFDSMMVARSMSNGGGPMGGYGIDQPNVKRKASK